MFAARSRLRVGYRRVGEGSQGWRPVPCPNGVGEHRLRECRRIPAPRWPRAGDGAFGERLARRPKSTNLPPTDRPTLDNAPIGLVYGFVTVCGRRLLLL